MNVFPASLSTALTVQVLCQLFKVVYYSIRDRKVSPRYFFSAGGVPSAHTAFVTALAVSIGLRGGFDSDLFAVAFVLAAIVIYDAYRLRGAVEKHAKVLNRLSSRYFPEEKEKLSEMIGHSLGEILWGLLIGSLFAWGVTVLIFPPG
jgi:hypothetical protein